MDVEKLDSKPEDQIATELQLDDSAGAEGILIQVKSHALTIDALQTLSTQVKPNASASPEEGFSVDSEEPESLWGEWGNATTHMKRAPHFGPKPSKKSKRSGQAATNKDQLSSDPA